MKDVLELHNENLIDPILLYIQTLIRQLDCIRKISFYFNDTIIINLEIKAHDCFTFDLQSLYLQQTTNNNNNPF